MSEQITQKDADRIAEEIQHRKLVIRKEAIAAVQEARAHGDLSENFEYKAAKQYKNQNESRIRYLEKLLKNAVIVTESTTNAVGVNTRVRLFFPEDQQEETYHIVTSIRGNTLKGRISIDSPLGKALLHHKKGETVEVVVNSDYSYPVEILDVVPYEDDGSENIRRF